MRSRASSCAVSSAVAVAASALLVAVAQATEQPNTCIAGKLACTNACTSAVFKSGFTAENGDKAEECIRKARRKFGTAVSGKVQCWDKIESKEKAERFASPSAKPSRSPRS
jgi:hypothetical protein